MSTDNATALLTATTVPKLNSPKLILMPNR